MIQRLLLLTVCFASYIRETVSQCPIASNITSYQPAAAYESVAPGLFIDNTNIMDPLVCGVERGTELCCSPAKISEAATALANQKKTAFEKFYKKIKFFASQASVYDQLLNSSNFASLMKKDDPVLNTSVGNFNVTNSDLVGSLRRTLSSSIFDIRFKMAKMALPACMEAHVDFYSRVGCYVCMKSNYKINVTDPTKTYLNNSYMGAVAVTPESVKSKFKKCIPVWRFNMNVMSVMALVAATKKAGNSDIKIPIDKISPYFPSGNISQYFANSESLTSERAFSCALEDCSPSSKSGFYSLVYQVSNINPFFGGEGDYIPESDGAYSKLDQYTTDLDKKRIGFLTYPADPTDIENQYTNIDYTAYYSKTGISCPVSITSTEVEAWTADVILNGAAMYHGVYYERSIILTLTTGILAYLMISI